MPDANNPAPAGTGEAAPIVEQSPIDALADILDEPATDNGETEAAKPADTRTKASDPLDEVLGSDDATDDETSDGETKDGPARDAAGRFVSPNEKVRLPDGTTTTIAELSQGHLRQSDYTRKTQELAEQRQAFEAERTRANETYQHLQAQFQQVSNWLEATKPQRPQIPYEADLVAWGRYQQEKDQWDEAQRYWVGQAKQVQETRKAEQQASFEKHLRTESEALFKAIPAFRDPGKRDAFVTEAARLFEPYGIKREEIAGLTDHRMIRVLVDAVKLHRLQARKPAVQAALKDKPPVIRGSKRVPPTSKDEQLRRQRTDRLNETGAFQDAVPALAHLLD